MSNEELSDEQLLARLRRATLLRALDILEDEGVKIPPGQLIGLVGKVGVKDEPAEEKKADKTADDLFEFLPGLPAERRHEVLDQFQAKLDKAREEQSE